MSMNDIEPGQTWVIDRLRPEDAEGVTRLFRSVYGEGYPIRTYIDPQLLIQENEAHRTVSSVARTPKGDIVGHNAIFHSAPSDRIFESGSGLVHRHYRGGHGIFKQLGFHGQKIAEEEFGAAAIWGEPVSNHIYAQKATNAFGWRIFALEVDLMPASAYVKEAGASGRVSTFMSFLTFKERRHRVFLPPVYEARLKSMYGRLLDERDVSPSTSPPQSDVRTGIDVQLFSFASVARMACNSIGEDFEAVLDAKEAEAVEQKTEVLQLWLKLTDPAVGWAVDKLRPKGYFLGGPLPRWFDDDGLLVQKTLSPPRWDSIAIAFEYIEKIVELVKEDWAAVEAMKGR